MILTVFLPVFILSLFTLSTFDTENELGDRVANLAAIFLAFVAYLPMVRAEIPNVAYFTLTDIVIYLNMFSILVALLESYLAKHDSSTKTKNALLVVALVFTGVGALMVLLPAVNYWVFQKKKYNTKPKRVQKRSGDFNPLDWTNQKLVSDPGTVDILSAGHTSFTEPLKSLIEHEPVTGKWA